MEGEVPEILGEFCCCVTAKSAAWFRIMLTVESILMNKKGCLFAALYVFGLFVFMGTLGQFLEARRNQIPSREAVNNLFGALALIAFSCLLVGLAFPKFYTLLLKTKATRKHISYIFGTAFFLCAMISGSTLSDVEKAEQKKQSEIRATAKAAKKEAKALAKQAEVERVAVAPPPPVQSEMETKPSGNGLRGLLRKVGDSTYTIRVSGTSGLAFSGSYLTFTTDGTSSSKTVDGNVPTEYTVSGSMVSVSFQKEGEAGELKVEIVKSGQVVSDSDTSAKYGVVSVATN